ncbi:uncharacterized protein LOC105662632 isoform X2 [Megachile rotundata]|uniref:uncharacterized protein LOC105662632 isoform X2 n=1 Tax=Megachile rotundata TaxID=143995 RepID=UPI003FD285A6
MFHELGLINELQTTETEDVREVLHKMAKKKLPLSGGLSQLKQKSEYNTLKEKLMIRH